MNLVTKTFWLDTAERAVKTLAQTLVALLGAGAVDVLHIDWKARLSVAMGAALVSILTSIASSNVNSADSASLVK